MFLFNCLKHLVLKHFSYIREHGLLPLLISWNSYSRLSIIWQCEKLLMRYIHIPCGNDMEITFIWWISCNQCSVAYFLGNWKFKLRTKANHLAITQGSISYEGSLWEFAHIKLSSYCYIAFISACNVGMHHGLSFEVPCNN